MIIRDLLAVAVGGMIGTSLRIGLTALFPNEANEFPWSTLVENVVGSFLLGLLVARLWPVAPSWVRAGLGPGVLGSFTTFSAIMTSLITLTSAGEALLAGTYLVASLVLSFAAAVLGLSLGKPHFAEIGVDE